VTWYVMTQLASQRVAELQRAARRPIQPGRPVEPGRLARRGYALRQNAGWLMVELGLRLASSSRSADRTGRKYQQRV
jgi:hypothetical protein